MDSLEQKRAAYAQLSRLAKAVSSPPRLELLDYILQAPRSVDELTRLTGLNTANASQHLQVLHRANLLQRDKQGTTVTYSVANASVADFFSALEALARAQLPEMREVMYQFHERGQARIAPDAFLQRLRDGDIAIVDVRPAKEFANAHFDGAVNIPIDEFEQRIDELPTDREVVAYCRGPYCVWADRAVALLRASGREASKLESRVSELRADGIVVEMSASEQ